MGDATSSILVTIKKMLGVAQEYNAFNVDIIVGINSVFLSLNQIGVGPKTPFRITGEDETWANFLGDQRALLPGVEEYVYLKSRLLFDPPANSFVVTAMEEQAKELEWRLNLQAERASNSFESSPSPPPDEDEDDRVNEETSEGSAELRKRWGEVRRNVSRRSYQEPDTSHTD